MDGGQRLWSCAANGALLPRPRLCLGQVALGCCETFPEPRHVLLCLPESMRGTPVGQLPAQVVPPAGALLEFRLQPHPLLFQLGNFAFPAVFEETHSFLLDPNGRLLQSFGFFRTPLELNAVPTGLRDKTIDAMDVGCSSGEEYRYQIAAEGCFVEPRMARFEITPEERHPQRTRRPPVGDPHEPADVPVPANLERTATALVAGRREQTQPMTVGESAEHPANELQQCRLATAVGSIQNLDFRSELIQGNLRKGPKALHVNAMQLHMSDPERGGNMGIGRGVEPGSQDWFEMWDGQAVSARIPGRTIGRPQPVNSFIDDVSDEFLIGILAGSQWMRT